MSRAIAGNKIRVFRWGLWDWTSEAIHGKIQNIRPLAD